VSDVLVVAEHRGGRLRDVTFECITAAGALGEVTVAIIAADPLPLVADASVEGVTDIVTVTVECGEFEADIHQAAVERLIRALAPRVVIAGHSVNGSGLAPAVAVRLGLGFASDVFDIAREGDVVVAQRSMYGGKVHVEIDFSAHEQAFLLVRPGAYPPAAGSSQPAVSALAPEPVDSRSRHRAFVAPERSDDIDITQAPVILSIGRGVGEEANIGLFASLAERMGARLAASRPLVDAGWLPPSRQVGQSGQTVAPAVYLALGISGAIQHLIGMKGSGTVIAVNTDPDAPIFSVAHYGAVADIFEVAAELTKLYSAS